MTTHELDLLENAIDSLVEALAKFEEGDEGEPKCYVPCDHIPIRSRPLFWARDMMRDLIETLKAEQST
ncbi:MAG: hypothetical protein RI925_1033 [Pseudomonadota bacterium]